MSLTDEEVSTICCGLLMESPGAKPRKQLERESELVWKLAAAKRDYDRMMAESTPLLLVERLRRLPRPSYQADRFDGGDANTVRPEAPTFSEPQVTA